MAKHEITLETSPLAANSPRTQSLAELEKGSINRPQVLSQSPFSTQPPNLTHDARILNSNLSHSHTANVGSLDSKIESKNTESIKDSTNKILNSMQNLKVFTQDFITSKSLIPISPKILAFLKFAFIQNPTFKGLYYEK